MLSTANTTPPVALLINIPPAHCVDHGVDQVNMDENQHMPALAPLTDIDRHTAALCGGQDTMEGPVEEQGALEEHRTLQGTSAPPPSAMVVVLDAHYDPTHPAWPLRNVLAMLAARLGACRLCVLCVRGDQQRGVDVARCRVMDLVLPALPGGCAGCAAWYSLQGWYK